MPFVVESEAYDNRGLRRATFRVFVETEARAQEIVLQSPGERTRWNLAKLRVVNWILARPWARWIPVRVCNWLRRWPQLGERTYRELSLDEMPPKVRDNMLAARAQRSA